VNEFPRQRVVGRTLAGHAAARPPAGWPHPSGANQALSAARAPRVEHGFSDLKDWRILNRFQLSPAKTIALLRALLVLTRQHTTR
jgi:hypothetical protein